MRHTELLDLTVIRALRRHKLPEFDNGGSTVATALTEDEESAVLDDFEDVLVAVALLGSCDVLDVRKGSDSIKKNRIDKLSIASSDVLVRRSQLSDVEPAFLKGEIDIVSIEY